MLLKLHIKLDLNADKGRMEADIMVQEEKGVKIFAAKLHNMTLISSPT